MPLTFLTTADGGHDERSAPHGARPARPAGGWRRPYSPGPWRVAAVLLLLVLTSYLLFAALVVAMAGSSSKALVMTVAGVLVVLLGLRILRVGLWVGREGLRAVQLLRTTTLPWEQVGTVRTAQQPVRLLSLPRTVQGQALIVQRRDGAPLPLLLTDHNPDFLGRPEGFDVAADAIEGWAAAVRRG